MVILSREFDRWRRRTWLCFALLCGSTHHLPGPLQRAPNVVTAFTRRLFALIDKIVLTSNSIRRLAECKTPRCTFCTFLFCHGFGSCNTPDGPRSSTICVGLGADGFTADSLLKTESRRSRHACSFFFRCCSWPQLDAPAME